MTNTSDDAIDRDLKQALAHVSTATPLHPDPVAAVRRRVHDRRHRRWRRAVLATAATILVVAGAVTLVGGGSDDEFLDIVSPSTVEQPPTTATPTSPPSSITPPSTASEPGPQPPGAPPLSFRNFVALTWTGSEVVVDDQAAYNPNTDTWRTLGPSPLPVGSDAPVITTMTDLGVVVVQGITTALWDPGADTWRQLDDAPEPSPSPEGEMAPQVIDLAGDGDRVISHSANAVLDVTSGTWMRLDDPPVALVGVTTAWTGDELLAVGGPGTRFASAAAIAVDPDIGAWRTLPSPPGDLHAEALAASWDGQRVVVTNYDMTAATYEPESGKWTSLPPVPARFYEWSPLTVSTGGTTITLMSQSVAVLGDGDRWEPYPYGSLNAGPVVGLGGTGQVASWGTDYESMTNALTITDLATLVGTPRRQVGTASVELAPGDEVTESSYDDSNGLVQTVELTIATDAGGTCTIASTYLGMVGPNIDGPVREELPGADGPITWAHDELGTAWETEATTSDLFRISCDQPADARRLVGTARLG